MKKLFNLLAVICFLCACAGVSSYDGSSTKQWIEIESSKQDLEGKTVDVCYRLNVRFSPQEVTQRFDTDKACITKCCWYSDTKKITLHLNADFAKELKEKGQANKYSTDTLVFNIKYSNLLDTIHSSLSPSSVLRYDGLITLDYTPVNGDESLLQIGLGDLKVKDYTEEETKNPHQGTYLYSEQEKVMAEYQEAVNKLKELEEYQKVDTGLTPSKVAAPNAETPVVEQAVLPSSEPVVNQETYDLNDAAQRQALLEKKLAYERSQAVALLKRFYEQDIDEYIRFIDKAQAAKGYVLLANDREWKTTKIGYPIYRVNCAVKGKLGKTQNTLKDYPLACGTYEVDLDEKTVLPKDITAITIVNKDYKY